MNPLTKTTHVLLNLKTTEIPELLGWSLKSSTTICSGVASAVEASSRRGGPGRHVRHLQVIEWRLSGAGRIVCYLLCWPGTGALLVRRGRPQHCVYSLPCPCFWHVAAVCLGCSPFKPVWSPLCGLYVHTVGQSINIIVTKIDRYLIKTGVIALVRVRDLSPRL